MKLLSIDGSTNRTGWAIFDGENLIDSGCIVAEEGEKDFRIRIKFMMMEIDKIIRNYNPDRLAMEDVPLKKGADKVLLMLGVLQGSVLGLCASHDIFIEFIPVSQWRSKLGLFDGTEKGKERGEMKRKSIEFVNKKFNKNLIYKSPTSKFNQDDEADAICIGLSTMIEVTPKKGIGRKSNV